MNGFSFDSHNILVRELSEKLSNSYARKQKVRIKHGSTNSTRLSNDPDVVFLNISSLNNIIEIQEKGRYAWVEPNVSMDRLVEATLKFGLIPEVVMEFPGITVGGGIQGGAGESSSFKYGLFHDTCDEYEIILGDGRIVRASLVQNQDLYWGTACSYGTFGVLSLAKVRLIPADPYIHLTYSRMRNTDDLNKRILERARPDIDFIDGIMFTPDLGCVMEGKFSKKINLPISRFTRAFDEWFYIHSESKINEKDMYEELIPIKDYLFRYDRGAFWGGKYTMARYNMPFNRFSRFLLNPLFKTRRMYKLLHATGLAQQYMIQDVSIPSENIPALIEFINKKLKIYPLWFCPLRVGIKDPLSPSYLKDTNLVVNVGIWGGECKNFEIFKLLNRELEQVVREVGGRKVLYAHAYYPEEEFWSIYDKKWYERLRDKYNATRVFPDIYHKVYVSKRYKVAIRNGVRTYLLESTKSLIHSLIRNLT